MNRGRVGASHGGSTLSVHPLAFGASATLTGGATGGQAEGAFAVPWADGPTTATLSPQCWVTLRALDNQPGPSVHGLRVVGGRPGYALLARPAGRVEAQARSGRGEYASPHVVIAVVNLAAAQAALASVSSGITAAIGIGPFRW